MDALLVRVMREVGIVVRQDAITCQPIKDLALQGRIMPDQDIVDLQASAIMFLRAMDPAHLGLAMRDLAIAN